jgi:hypothetical protein
VNIRRGMFPVWVCVSVVRGNPMARSNLRPYRRHGPSSSIWQRWPVRFVHPDRCVRRPSVRRLIQRGLES